MEDKSFIDKKQSLAKQNFKVSIFSLQCRLPKSFFDDRTSFPPQKRGCQRSFKETALI